MARGAAVLATALALSLPLAALPSPAEAAPQPPAAGEVVLPAAPRAVPRATQILNAGTSGFLWAQEGDDRLLWTDYTTGTTTSLQQLLDVPVQYDIDSGYFREAASFQPGYYGDGSDTVALYSKEDAQVTLLQAAGASGGSTVVPVPEYHAYQGTFGSTVLTSTSGVNGGPNAYQLWRVEDGGGTGQTPVTGLPDRAGNFVVEDGDARSVLLRYDTAEDDWSHWGIVDLATGVFSTLPDRIDPENGWEVTGFQLGTDSVLRLRSGRGKADLYDRDDLSGAPRTFDTGALSHQAAYGIVGDELLGLEPVSPGDNKYRGQPLWALTSDGTETDLTKVMDPAGHGIVQAPDGSVLVAGAEQYVERGDLDWGVYRITRAADGSVTRSRLTTVQPMPAQIHGLSLGSGILSRADNSTLYEPNTILGAYRSTWFSTNGTPTVTKATVDGLINGSDGDCSADTPHCIRMFADGTGRHGRRDATESGLTMLRSNGATTWGPTLDTGDDAPWLTDLSGRYAVVNSASSGYQYIGEFADGSAGRVLLKRDRVAAAVWGNTLWSGAATGGKVTATRLPSGTAVESFTTRDGCTPTSLQAVGRWVYWTCEDTLGDGQGSGVYDRTAKRTATAPGGRILLGDGYLVERVAGTRSGSGLTLLDLHNGLPSSGSHTDLPSRKLADWTDIGRDNLKAGTSWTVDRFGGGVAFADREQRVHLVPTGVPASALSAIDSTVTPGAASWSGTWWLSRPAATWKVVVRHKASGTTVRTVSGSAARGLLTAAWDGKDSAGRLVTNGTYTWTLTAQPADGQGTALTLSGTIGVTAGAAAPHDYAGNDGIGDILTLNSSGTLTIQRGTGTGSLGSKVSGGGWPTTARFVPLGDLSGDRCNDVLVRLSSGALRAYRPGCGKAATPSTPYTTLATSGWNQYDLLTSPGDVSRDGRPDLIARNASTGAVYLYKGTSTGKLSARVKLYGDWKAYKKVVGAGDLNGDGVGDLLVQDKSNNLYRYDGTGSGTFKARVKLFSNWGASYNAVVAAGDITGDGRTDLVSRDTSGNLFRHSGDSKGSFGGRVKIATGWQGYKAVV
ncbi:FG-GAP-like repeat-containing protein [Streptomyces sp. SP18BB07]|uniref:FG-GAP-like repeat-containing protein n=1 Tax=Streptomyces sp. SP18BB07 TaxID=3002522 RepID=UPI002E77E856|nr:FG-GAP-like repeat-containing protein [Streptomyces sp. SP18BB07]MEE1764782.1 FG-GAP-like repeat-containing protein [Streptomyces sp. SP18BB07]